MPPRCKRYDRSPVKAKPTLRCICGHQQSTHAGGKGACNGFILTCHCKHFTVERNKKGYYGLWSDDQILAAIAKLDGQPFCSKPYLTSLDAIVPVIQKQRLSIRRKFHLRVSILCTPREVCMALLKATKLWIV
jgi:hypothetical protein